MPGGPRLAKRLRDHAIHRSPSLALLQIERLAGIEDGDAKLGPVAPVHGHDLSAHRLRVPAAARSTFASITPVNIAAWALGGFYFSLMPAVVRVATGATLPVVGGIVVAVLTFAGGSSGRLGGQLALDSTIATGPLVSAANVPSWTPTPSAPTALNLSQRISKSFMASSPPGITLRYCAQQRSKV